MTLGDFWYDGTHLWVWQINPIRKWVQVANITDIQAGGAHPLLDANIDSDTKAYTPAKGSLIHGDSSTPSKWDGFGIGTTGQYLRVSGGDETWSSEIDTETGAALPGAGTAGRLFQRTSDNTLWFDTGMVWVQP